LLNELFRRVTWRHRVAAIKRLAQSFARRSNFAIDAGIRANNSMRQPRRKCHALR